MLCDLTWSLKTMRLLCALSLSMFDSATPWLHSPPGSSAHRIFQPRYWSGCHFLPREDLPDSDIEPVSLESLALLRGSSLPLVPPGKSLGAATSVL